MSQLVIIFGLNIQRPSLASTVRPRKIVKLFNQLLGRFRGNNQQCSATLCNMYCRVEYRGNMKSSKYLEIIIVLFNNTVLLSSSEDDQPLPACCSQGAHHANAWLSSPTNPPLPPHILQHTPVHSQAQGTWARCLGSDHYTSRVYSSDTFSSEPLNTQGNQVICFYMMGIALQTKGTR